MTYFLFQFFFYLAIALLLGVIIGWLIWGGAQDVEQTESTVGADAFRDRMVDAPQRTEETAALRTQIDELAAQLQARESDVARLRKRLRRATVEQGAQLSAALAPSEGVAPAAPAPDVARIESDLRRQLEVELGDRHDAEKRELQRRLDAVTAEHQLAKETVPGASDDAVRALNDELDASRTKLGAAQSELAAERAKRSELESQAGRLSGVAPVSAEELTTLSARAQSAETRAQAADSRATELEESLVALRRQLDEQAARLHETVRLQTAGPDLSQLQAELEAARGEAAQAVKSASSYQAQLAQLHSQQLSEVDAARLQARQAEERALEIQREAAEAQRRAADRAAEIQRQAEDRAAAVQREAHARVEQAEERSQLAEHEVAERVSALERQSREAVAAARAAEDRHVSAASSVEQLQTEVAAIRRDYDDRVKALQLELGDTRLRADAAQETLQELSGELSELRDWNAQLLQNSRSRMDGLQSRLEAAHGALKGGPSAPRHMVNAPVNEHPDDLSALAGVDRLLGGHLGEVGVVSYRQIGEWNDDDVDRYQRMLSDFPNVIRSNDWVLAARRLWAEKNGRPWAERDGATRIGR